MKNKYDKPLNNADDYVSRQPSEYRETLHFPSNETLPAGGLPNDWTVFEVK